MKKWLKRIGLWLVGLIVFAVTGGAIFEQIGRHDAPVEFPVQGKLVDIGGRRLQIDCRGTGSPTVVFEAGLDIWGSLSFRKIQDKIAAVTRACSYSRAGILWSDPAPGTRDAKAIAADLHTLLQKAGEHGPFVLVGHSLAGPYTVTYTQAYGAEVAGLVLVDPSHPDQQRRFDAIAGHPLNFLAQQRVIAALTWTGLPRLVMQPRDEKADAGDRVMAAYGPVSFGAVLQEGNAIDQTFAETAAAHALGNRPLIILTAANTMGDSDMAALGLPAAKGTEFRKAWSDMHDDMATWASAGLNVQVAGTGHYIQDQKPDAVVDAIKSVIAAVRGG